MRTHRSSSQDYSENVKQVTPPLWVFKTRKYCHHDKKLAVFLSYLYLFSLQKHRKWEGSHFCLTFICSTLDAWFFLSFHFSSVQFSSAAQSCPNLYNPMNHSTPGIPVHYQLPEFTQTRPSSQWCHPAISSCLGGLHRTVQYQLLQHLAFFTVQLSHPYMSTEKNHSLD